jgi:hypothetical protein
MGYPASGGRWACVVRAGHFFYCRAHDSTWNNNDVAAGTLTNSGNVILDAQGDPTAVFVFQAASTAITSVGSTMTLANGAQACNVYWRVGSSATIGVDSTFIGHVYALTSITANTGAQITGQLLARNGAVTLDTNRIVNNVCTATATTTTRATTTVAGSATTIPGGGILPLTGAYTETLVFFAVVLVVLGIVKIVVDRRRY